MHFLLLCVNIKNKGDLVAGWDIKNRLRKRHKEKIYDVSYMKQMGMWNFGDQ